MIRYLWESLRPSIRAQLDTRGRDLDSWEKAVEKAVNAEAKALLQLSSSTCKMDWRYPRGNRAVKKEDSRRTKSIDTSSADVSSGKHQ